MIEVKHEILKLPQQYRCIVVSDIHSHCSRFKQLLEKVEFKADDYLIINGDFVEKGTETMQTVDYIRYLQNTYPHVYVVLGNCEYALETLINDDRFAGELIHYFNKIGKSGIIDQSVKALGLDINHDDPQYIQQSIRNYTKDYLDYISSLPTSLEADDFLIVHSGIENKEDWKDAKASSFIEMRTFQQVGHTLDKYVIVGHLPTSNFHADKICNHILFDEEKKIISIDGGTGVKFISQLNALIIEKKEKLTFKQVCVQPLPLYTFLHDVEGKAGGHKIAWPNFEVEVLQRREHFSLCKQINTDIVLDIKNEFLYEKEGRVYCLDDYVDTFVEGKAGQTAKLVGIYNKHAYVISDNEIGWVEADALSCCGSESHMI